MSNFIRGGVPRDINLGGFTFQAAEGETSVLRLSGRGGTVKLSGSSLPYKESNPQIGAFNQTLTVDEDDFANLRTLQDSNEVITGYVTMPSGKTYNLFVSISNDDALELDNGTVSLETMGNVELQ
jgi:hypothetical protein